ncbi:quinon protein alcohol dehydrogenase-like superfamily [Suillus ampliporus]|nr:quinon protein alcohol dehydrogenase-like superfamily [Suillus ampliporus]
MLRVGRSSQVPWTVTQTKCGLLDISPDGCILASGSWDRTVILWDTKTWQRKGYRIFGGAYVNCVRFSPIGQLGVATSDNIQIWDVARRECLAQFKGHNDFNYARNWSLTWTHDGAHLFSAGDYNDPVIRSWDTSTWKQVDSWTSHDDNTTVHYITLNPAGTLLASASGDHIVRLWQLPTGTEVARFRHSDAVILGAFSVDGRSIFSGGNDKKMSQWEIPEQVLSAVQSDSLGENNEARPSLRKKRNIKRLLDNTRPESPSSSCLDADATGGDGIIKEEYDDPYNDNFFQVKRVRSHLFHWHLLASISPGLTVSGMSSLETVSQQTSPFHWNAPTVVSLVVILAQTHFRNLQPVTPTQPMPEVKVRAGKEDEQGEMDDDCSTNGQPGASKRCKGKGPGGSLLDVQSILPDDPAHPAELDSEENCNLWSRLMHSRGKDPTSAKMAPATKRPEVVEVYAVRGFRGHVALTLRRKKNHRL